MKPYHSVAGVQVWVLEGRQGNEVVVQGEEGGDTLYIGSAMAGVHIGLKSLMELHDLIAHRLAQNNVFAPKACGTHEFDQPLRKGGVHTCCSSCGRTVRLVNDRYVHHVSKFSKPCRMSGESYSEELQNSKFKVQSPSGSATIKNQQTIIRCPHTRKLDVTPPSPPPPEQTELTKAGMLEKMRASRRFASSRDPIFIEQQCLLTIDHGGGEAGHGEGVDFALDTCSLDHVYPGADGLPGVVKTRVYRDEIDYLSALKQAQHRKRKIGMEIDPELLIGWPEYYARHRVFYCGMPGEVSSSEFQVSSLEEGVASQMSSVQNPIVRLDPSSIGKVYPPGRVISVGCNIAALTQISRQLATEMIAGFEHGQRIELPWAAADDLPEGGLPVEVYNRSKTLQCSYYFGILPLTTVGDLLWQVAHRLKRLFEEMKMPISDLIFEAVKIGADNRITVIVGN